MTLRARLVGVLSAGVALLFLTSTQAWAATSYWTLYNPGTNAAGKSFCITSGSVDGWAAVIECSGTSAQDWAFTKGPIGQYLVSRAYPGYVMALSSLSVGAHLTLDRYDPSDLRQIFVAGDPVKAHHNHVRPYYSPGLCLESRPWRTNFAPVLLRRCDTNSTGSQAWLSRFHGNY